MEPPGGRYLDGCIVFDGSKFIFYSGQLIEGKINFKLHSPLDISALDIIFFGEGNVVWVEEQMEMYGGVRRQKFVTYHGKEGYINHVQRLQGPTVLEAGEHSIPFSYQLPYTCPSTFRGSKGQVTYSATALFTRQDGVTKDKITTEIDVIDPMNLNTGSADILKPLVMEFEEEMSCQWCWSSKPLGITVRLPAQGMCPGEVVPVTVAVRNSTSVEINKIIFQITTRERYRSLEPASEYEPPEEVLMTMKKGPFLSNTNKDYVFELTVPDFIAPNMEKCNIIDVGYFFKVIIKLSGCNEDMEDEAEICIGLVPIGVTTDLTQHPMADKLPSGPIPDPNNAVNLPPEYQSYPTHQTQTNVQAYSSGPIPYPISANVTDAPMYGSKNSLVNSFEIGFRVPDGNSSVSVQMTSVRHSPTGVEMTSVSQSSRSVSVNTYSGQNPPYPTQSYGSQPSAPSAPPPY
ncbi:arrestin domain-containing protein 2-like [Maniola jurtina]|uniref:arrestin domain-containing protein 2-like n=1 Tax=Maniola jurtina TaxID=191418 RepID=UPI001E68A756|nr:arrestin domain-containing protein 2-like [Maniola jurtina]XP_045776139.1 arrestin domain-containing protein 2-like [Maniola jurtina]